MGNAKRKHNPLWREGIWMQSALDKNRNGGSDG